MDGSVPTHSTQSNTCAMMGSRTGAIPVRGIPENRVFRERVDRLRVAASDSPDV